MTRIARAGAVLLPLAVLACMMWGCGPGTVPTVEVSGTVTLDGKPLEGAMVGFYPATGGAPATGQTDSAGKFKLKAPAGKAKVSVSKTEAGGEAKVDQAAAGAAPAGTALSGPPVAGGAPPPPPKSVVPAKYTNPDMSGITVEVKSGMQPVTIELKSQ